MITEETNDYAPLGLSLEYHGGKGDGAVFQHVCLKSRQVHAWISDSYPGQHFKQVMVPLDFEHPDIVP